MRKVLRWVSAIGLVGLLWSFLILRQPRTESDQGDWLPWLGLLFEVLGKVDWLNALLIVTAALIVVLILIAQFSPSDGFDMRSMMASRSLNARGLEVWTVEPGRVYQTGAFMFTSWALVWVVTHDKLTEIFLFVYVALWAGSRAMNRVIESKFPVAPGTPALDVPPAAERAGVVTTTTTEIKQGAAP